ncbi:pyruvate decarboxylase-like protein [Halenospora varia]|nr:pyruvate decarboxylase-like protein [Halenospora varia]
MRTSALKSPIDAAEYLFTRLRQIGILSIHGVPGDYSLVALDYIPKTGLKWVGNVNELNAVGELSAINAITGAYSEHVPIVHIVGTPSTISQRDGMLLHHKLGNGKFNVFADMSRDISCSMAKLNDPYECWIQSRPVYITLPIDTVQKKIEGERLKTPIDLHYLGNDTAKEDYVVDVVLKYLQAAKNPIILVDACAIRHRALEEVHDLIDKTGLPVFVTPMGKGAVNETRPNYGGVYAGNGSQPDVKERVEASGLILTIGAIKSDFITAGFSYKTSQFNTIDFHSTHTVVRYSECHGIDPSKLSAVTGLKAENKAQNEDNSETITHAWFWRRVGQFVKEIDIVITETGTANFGAALAARDAGSERRTILFVGDGSLQLTCQEISTIIRLGLKPIIFVICNDGFTIERFIHGMDAVYNDIASWHFKDLVKVFGAEEGNAKTFQIESKELFEDKQFNVAECIQFVELYIPKKDAPRALKLTADASVSANTKQ